MGASSSKDNTPLVSVNPQLEEQQHIPDKEFRPGEEPSRVNDSEHNITNSTALHTLKKEEEERRRQKEKRYAKLKSNVKKDSKDQTNTIQEVYEEDFESIDHIQAVRFPISIAKQLQAAVHNECVRRCYEKEKTMSRCLQDKMWTTWKCQKERDAYYECIREEEGVNTSPSLREEREAAAAAAANNNSNNNNNNNNTNTTVATTTTTNNNTTNTTTTAKEAPVDLLTAYRWKYTLGVLTGEITARNNIMKAIWAEHYPDRELPHSWVNETS